MIQILGGGHPDFLLLGWSHGEHAPPALETREQLQRTSYQFIRLAPAGEEEETRRLQVRYGLSVRRFGGGRD